MKLLFILEDEDDDIGIEYAYYKRKKLQTNEIFRNRFTEGCFNTFIMRHLYNNATKFKEYFRLSPDQFDYFLSLIENDIVKLSTSFVQTPVTRAERLAATLRQLGTGESFRSLAFGFRISHCHISQIVREVLRSLCEKLAPIFLPNPTKERIKSVASDFYELWDFLNCCGAIDGKHCRIVCPDVSWSLFFNYKSFYSIVLLALVDARYRFIAIDVGSYGKEGDRGIYHKSNFKNVIPLLMPEDSPLPDNILPHVIVGDEAFHLSKNLMRPYPKSQCFIDNSKHIFNQRLCRARRTVENAFDIMSKKFRVFYTPIAIKPETADLLITACCCLHNLMRSSNLREEEEILLPTENCLPLTRVGGNCTAEAFRIREELNNYFCSREGNIKWLE
ncbi:uncharacterized protein [Periplaneta americana]|uniref:uncharacterized protein n=1 Tax=Periplaneta americana TaxID=6978 RepID=UPI0037E8ACA8